MQSGQMHYIISIWSGIRCLTNSEIRRVVLTVLSSFLRQSCLVFTNVTSALEVFLKCYALYKSTFYLLTYLRIHALVHLHSWPWKYKTGNISEMVKHRAKVTIKGLYKVAQGLLIAPKYMTLNKL